MVYEFVGNVTLDFIVRTLSAQSAGVPQCPIRNLPSLIPFITPGPAPTSDFW